MNKKLFNSKLEKKLTISIIISLIISSLIAFSINSIAEYALDKYYTESSFLQNKSIKALSDFKSYVKENNISINNHSKIEKWIRNYKYIDIYIFENNQLVYNSNRYSLYNNSEAIPKESIILGNSPHTFN